MPKFRDQMFDLNRIGRFYVCSVIYLYSYCCLDHRTGYFLDEESYINSLEAPS